MSAANASAPSTSLQEEMRAHEPSMEEILASIRRIIADDESLPPARRERDERLHREPPPLAIEPPASVQSAYPTPALDPAPAVRAPEPAPVTHARFEPAPPLRQEAAPVADIHQLRTGRVVTEPVLEQEPQEEDEGYAEAEDFAPSYAEEAEEPVVDYAFEPAAPLVSTDAASSIASHFQALAASMVINDSGLLQKYAQEMLRPMLKQWLDDNLPVIVERLVRAEIERVARGRR